jgi:hypothetical protein
MESINKKEYKCKYPGCNEVKANYTSVARHVKAMHPGWVNPLKYGKSERSNVAC